MTPRQALATLAAPHRYRVRLDPEGWPMIPGRYGRLEYQDGTLLAVYTDRPRLFATLWAVPGLRPWQVGDQEARGLFPVEALEAVAGVIQARQRRTGHPAGSPESSPGPSTQRGFSGVGGHLAPKAGSR